MRCYAPLSIGSCPEMSLQPSLFDHGLDERPPRHLRSHVGIKRHPGGTWALAGVGVPQGWRIAIISSSRAGSGSSRKRRRARPGPRSTAIGTASARNPS
nr:hypothetical protein CFP56_01144 [Quercus suber]